MLAIDDFRHIKKVKFSYELYANTMLLYKDC